MGYSIQPVQIWTNGTAATGNYIDASIVNDNLSDYAQFTGKYLALQQIAKDKKQSKA